MPGCLVLAALLAFAPVARAGLPEGYELVASERLAQGVEHLTIRAPGPQVVHVARISPDSPFVLRAVSPNGAAGRLERTSAMCVRVGCLVAVNGDFWEPQTKRPIGGIVSAGQLLRSPILTRDQLVLGPDGRLSTGALELRAALVSTDLRTLTVNGVDAPLATDGVVLHTRASGASLPADGSRLDLTIRFIRPTGLLHLRRTVMVHIVAAGWAAEPTTIPANGAVLSGRGSAARHLGDLWRRVQQRVASTDALLRLESTPAAVESIGGSPVLVRGGRFAFPDAATSFVRGRHPRTLVGRTASGTALLVTVDGRQPGHSEGMSLADAARLMIDLGAVDAINLDGGGSTTFVRRGEVVNRPSDRLVRSGNGRRIVTMPGRSEAVIGHIERPVAVALALVPRPSNHDEGSGEPLLRRIELPAVVDLPVPHANDPASDATSSLPAVVARSAPARSPLPWVAAGVVGLALVLCVVQKRLVAVRS